MSRFERTGAGLVQAMLVQSPELSFIFAPLTRLFSHHLLFFFHLLPTLRRDYPRFFEQLYSLLEPGIFFVKYRVKFFHLLNFFLSSRLVARCFLCCCVDNSGASCPVPLDSGPT